MGNAERYTVIRAQLCRSDILCKTDFKDVAELVANEAAKYIDDGSCQMIFIIDSESGKHERIA